MTPRTLLGFDYGTQRIGVAVGQEVTGTVSPLTTLKCPQQAPPWDAITRLIEDWHPDLLVVGLPLNRDDSEHTISRAARRFGNQLKGRYNLPVEMIDERLSSMEAEAILSSRTKGRYDKTQIDSLAAQVILQTWLNQQQGSNQPCP